MLERLEKFFNTHLQADHPEQSTQNEQKIKIATTALFLEMAYADFEIDALEEQEILSSLQNLFGVDGQEISRLIGEAKAERASKNDIYGFTSLINKRFERDERKQILEQLWRLIYADGRIDKYEDALIRKITELLGLEHGEMIQAKLKMRPENI